MTASHADIAAALRDAHSRVDAEQAPNGNGRVAKYRTFERKEALLRPEQLRALADLADTVMAARPVKAERLTENTLIRVAVDLLLAHRDRLWGSTERELLKSLTTGVRNSRTPRHPNSREKS